MNNIFINSGIHKIGCIFDKCGNVYFYPSINPTKVFDLVINNKNDIYCEQITYSLFGLNKLNNSDDKSEDKSDDKLDDKLDDKCYTVGKLVIFDQTKTLKGTILKKKKNEDEANENDPNNEYNSDDEDAIKTTYYHEDNEFNEEIDREELDDTVDDTFNDYHHNPQSSRAPLFSFSSDDKTIKIKQLDNLIVDGDDNFALYDTLLYDGSMSSSNLIFKTKLLNDIAIYRLCIYTSGHITFRPIGSTEIKYIFNCNDDGLINIHKLL